MPKELVIHADGAARGNPGPAAIGVVVADKRGRVIEQVSEFIGRATNNVAEYAAVRRALELGIAHQADSVRLRLDSELLVKQLRGEYRVRSPQLRPLHREVMALLGRFARVDVQHVPRERNRLADRLANQALENKLRLARGITCTVNVPAPSRR